MLKGETKLTEHLHRLSRQRFNYSKEYQIRPSENRLQLPKDTIHRLEEAFTKMSREEIFMAFEAQQQELDHLICEYAQLEIMEAGYADDEPVQ